MGKLSLQTTYMCYEGAYGRQGGRKSVIMGAAVTLKDHLSFSIFVVFLFSLICLASAFWLSWSGKPDAPYFLVAAIALSLLGSVLCSQKGISLSEATSVIKLVFRK